MKKSTDSASNSTYSGSSYVTDRRKEWEERRRLEKEQEIEEQKKILKEMEEEKKREITKLLKENSPSKIAAELDEYIVNQPDLTRKTASFFYYHCLRCLYPELPSRPLLIAGASGSGKTEVFRVLKRLFGSVVNIQIVDASNLSLEGWAGSRKITHILKSVSSDTIVVWDEFDKLTHPKIGSNGLNVSTELQAEFLKLIEEPKYVVSEKDGNIINNLGTVFVGAFLSIQEEKNRCANNSIGFTSQKTEQPKYEEITKDDLFEYGVIGELLGRIAILCNTQPMTKEDCFNIVRHSKSRLHVIADMLHDYGIDAWENLSDEIILQIIEDSEFEKYGVRGVLSKIESIMLESIYEHGITLPPVDNKIELPQTCDNEIRLI